MSNIKFLISSVQVVLLIEKYEPEATWMHLNLPASKIF